jgi:hypothetical protein
MAPQIKSFRLARPTCPCCSSKQTSLHWTTLSNALRVPAAVISGLILYPMIGTRMVCKSCGHRFLTTRSGLDALPT